MTDLDQQLEHTMDAHKANVQTYIDARDAIETSACLLVAVAVACVYPDARWVILAESDQGEGMWLDAVVMADGSEVGIDYVTDVEILQTAITASGDIFERDGLDDLDYGYYALEIWPAIDAAAQ